MKLRVFTGFDERESEGWHACIESLARTSTNYMLMPRLTGEQKGGATNRLTHVRFLVPELCNWGTLPAVFLDAVDMILLANISELAELIDRRFAVQVVKHDYKTRHPRKYVGTAMESANEDYPRKNWSSVILWNCCHASHFKARNEIRAAVEAGDGKFLHRFGWLKDAEIGDLPDAWNWMPDEFGTNPEAKLLHWTAGPPFMPHYANAPMAEHWHAMRTIHSER